MDPEGQLLGIVSRVDVLRALAEPPMAETKHQVTTSKWASVTPETPLPEALRLLLVHPIKRPPVVDAEGRLIGLVGRGGVLQPGIGSLSYPLW